MKKIIALIVSAFVLLALVSCGKDKIPTIDPDGGVNPDGSIDFPITDLNTD